MKKSLVALMVLCMCLALTGCGSKNVVSGYKTGDVVLGQYKGLTYTAVSTEVTEDEIMAKVQADLIDANPETVEVTDRQFVEEGDFVNIDYVGTMDGVEFDGGSASNYELEIGSDSFIDGFEDGLIGKMVGENVVLDLTFPDPYKNNPDYSGLPVQFIVIINGIFEKVDPELTDELVAANTDYATVQEYKNAVQINLIAEKVEKAESQRDYELIAAALSNTEFKKDLSKEIYNAKESTKASYDSMYSAYGVDGATFFSYVYGMTAEQYDEYIEAQAKISVQFSYLLSAIAEAENLTVSDDEVQTLIDEMISGYGYETEEKLLDELGQYYNCSGREAVAAQAQLNKARDLIIDSAIAE